MIHINYARSYEKNTKRKVFYLSYNITNIPFVEYVLFILGTINEVKCCPAIDEVLHPNILELHMLKLKLYKVQSLELTHVHSNYYILLFPQAFSHVHESAMLPKSDIFLLLWNEWQGMGKRDKDESMMENGDRAKHTRNEDIASGGN